MMSSKSDCNTTGVLNAGTLAFSTGRVQIEEESGDEDEGSLEDDSSEAECADITRGREYGTGSDWGLMSMKPT
jgi:hypothetical protein